VTGPTNSSRWLVELHAHGACVQVSCRCVKTCCGAEMGTRRTSQLLSVRWAMWFSFHNDRFALWHSGGAVATLMQLLLQQHKRCCYEHCCCVSFCVCRVTHGTAQVLLDFLPVCRRPGCSNAAGSSSFAAYIPRFLPINIKRGHTAWLHIELLQSFTAVICVSVPALLLDLSQITHQSSKADVNKLIPFLVNIKFLWMVRSRHS